MHTLYIYVFVFTRIYAYTQQYMHEVGNRSNIFCYQTFCRRNCVLFSIDLFVRTLPSLLHKKTQVSQFIS